MIRGIYDEENLALILEGHADYAPKGFDIVCAGVSALAFTYAKYTGGYKKSPKGMLIRSQNKDEKGKTVFDTVIGGLKLIERDYPENLLLTKGRINN